MATAIIVDKSNITRKVEEKQYSRFTIIPSKRSVAINDILPFRIKLTNIMVPGYNQNNIPGIGLQVIGYSNYIL
jgi:hypothetical protein